jgi:hypothetical protein
MAIFRFFISGKFSLYSLFKPFILLPVILFGITLFFSTNINAQGNLLITPRRALFEGTKRSLDINLANIGQDTAIYAISLVQMRMKADGAFETITEPDSGQRFADGFIRFFPRSVTLGPNESQVVKIQLVRTNQLTPGEYRSHFYFRSVPNTSPLGEEDKKAIDSTTISVQLIPIFGITIPIIIRSGESTTKVTLSDPGLEIVNDTISSLRFIFNRTGNMSVYGDIAVDHVSPQGRATRVGIANGVAVYTPNPVRRFKLNLNKLPGVDFRTGKLRITYSAPSDVKPAKYAEAELLLR